MIFTLLGGRLGLLHLRDCGGVGGSVFGEHYVLEFCGGGGLT